MFCIIEAVGGTAFLRCKGRPHIWIIEAVLRGVLLHARPHMCWIIEAVGGTASRRCKGTGFGHRLQPHPAGVHRSLHGSLWLGESVLKTRTRHWVWRGRSGRARARLEGKAVHARLRILGILLLVGVEAAIPRWSIHWGPPKSTGLGMAPNVILRHAPKASGRTPPDFILLHTSEASGGRAIFWHTPEATRLGTKRVNPPGIAELHGHARNGRLNPTKLLALFDP